MTAWTSVLGPSAVVLGLLLVPGLLLGLVLRLRGLLLLGAAAPLSVAVVAGSAVAAGALPAGSTVVWSWRVVLVGTAVAAVGLAVVDAAARALGAGRGRPADVLAARATAPAPSRLAAHATEPVPARRDRDQLRRTAAPTSRRAAAPTSRRAAVAPAPARGGRRDHGGRDAAAGAVRLAAGLLGALLGGALVAAGLRRAIPSPDAVSQSADELFHLNAVQFVLRTGDGSSLHLSRLTAPEATTAFYPGAWHDVAALVVQLTGVSIPVATSLLAMACAAVLWPLSAVVLADRHLPATPAGTGALVAAGVLAGCAPGFPWLALSWGVLYPTLLAVAVLPAVVALVLAVVQRLQPAWSQVAPLGAPGPSAASSDSGPLRATTLPAVLAALLLVVGGLGLAHPSAVAALAVVAGPLLVALAVRVAARALADPRTRLLTAVALACVLVLGAVVAVAAQRIDLLTAVAQYRWPDDVGLPQAAGQAALMAAPRAAGAPVALALLAAVGAAACVRRGSHAWLAVGWVLAGVLYVVAETTPADVLTGAWYNDSNRLAVLLVVPGAALAAVGAAVVGRHLADAVPRARGPVLVVAVGVPVALALVAALGPANGMPDARGAVAGAYPAEPGPDAVISADEVALYRRVAAEVPADAVIANDPFQGSSVVLAYADRTPLFPHLSGRWDADDLLLASSLNLVGTDPRVCAAARAKGVRYLLDTGTRSYPQLPKAPLFTGIVDAAGSGAFTLVDEVGTAKLYELTSCAGA